jgi:hypothetical protein
MATIQREAAKRGLKAHPKLLPIALIATPLVVLAAGACTLICVVVPLFWTGKTSSPVVADNSGTGKPQSSVPSDDPFSGRTSSSVPADYVRLASMITDTYSLEEKAKWANGSPLYKVGDMDAALDSLNGTQDATLRPAVDKLMAGRERCKQMVKGLKETVVRADARLKDVQDRADRGEFVHEVEERGGIGGQEIVRRRVDGGFDAVMVAGIIRMATGTPEMAKEMAKTNVRIEMAESRREAWADLTPHFAKIYGQRPARAVLAAPQIVAANPGKPSALAIVNTGGKLLTDVTVAIELAHFIDAPHASSRHLLFLTQWPANQTVYLNNADYRSCAILNTDKSGWRPWEAMPGYQQGRTGGALRDLGGVVEARVTIWAAEAYQSERTVKFPDVVLAGGRFELDALNRVTENEIMRELLKAHVASRPKDAKGQALQSWQEKSPIVVPPEFKTLGSKSWVVSAGPRIAELVRGTALEPEVQAFRANALEIVRQRRQKQFDFLTQASAPRQQWSGTWAFESNPPNSHGVNFPPELKTRVGSKGRIAVTFEANPAFAPVPAPLPGPFKGTTRPATIGEYKPPLITARIFDPERPNAYRPLTSEIGNNRGGRVVLYLRTPPMPPFVSSKQKKDYAAAQSTPNPAGQHTLENDDVSIELTCDENGLKGIASATGDRFKARYQFELVLKSAGPNP